MDFYNRITQLCEGKGVSLRQLGIKLGLASASIYKWKEHYPKGADLIKIAKYFNVSTDYLLGLDSSPRAIYSLNGNKINSNFPYVNNSGVTIFERINYVVKEQGINLRQVAEAIGFAPSTIYKWKTQSPKGSDVAKVAKYLDVTTDYLLGLDSHQVPELKQKDLADLTNKEIDHLKISSNLGFVLSEKDQSFLLNFAKLYANELRKKRDQKPKNSKD